MPDTHMEILSRPSQLQSLIYPDWPDAVPVLTHILSNLGELRFVRKRRSVLGVWFTAPNDLGYYFLAHVPYHHQQPIMDKLNQLVRDYVPLEEFGPWMGSNINEDTMRSLNKLLKEQQTRLQRKTKRLPIVEEAFVRLGIPFPNAKRIR